MTSDDSPTELQECILKCKDANQFFNFPTKEVMRSMWLYKLGLEEDGFYPSLSICDKHFSSKMFESNNKLKSIAVPDINLPAETMSIRSSKPENKTASIERAPVRNTGKKPIKIVDLCKLPTVASPELPINSDDTTQTTTNPESTLSWINDSSNILVDYQLKVKARTVCDVIEIPQYIVVFTVVKVKQSKKIQMSDIERERRIALRLKSKRPPVEKSVPRLNLKNIPEPIDFITIDDDISPSFVIKTNKPSESVQPQPGPLLIKKLKTAEIVKPQSDPLLAIPTNPPEIEHLDLTSTSINQTNSPEIEQQKSDRSLVNQAESSVVVKQKLLPTLINKTKSTGTAPRDSVPPIISQTKFLKIVPLKSIPPEIFQSRQLKTVQRKPPAVILQKPVPIVKKPPPPPPEPEKEIDIVYYTTDDVPPTRTRAIQCDLSKKYKETAIQCDVQLDTDIMEMSYNADLFWMKSRFNKANHPDEINMDECLICGEILSSYLSKVIHAQKHELSPSLCCQCGVMFDTQIKLRAHEKMFHSEKFKLQKPQRCPKRNCNKAFHSKKLLINHIEAHTLTKEHTCNKCLQVFSSAMKLSCHQRALDNCLRTRGWTSRRWTKRF